MSTTRTFSRAAIGALDSTRIVGVRSGTSHRFTGVWVVVVNGRVFARSWFDEPTGWFRAFLEEPRGGLELPNGRTIRVVAKRVRSERLLDAIQDAYREKYNTPASRTWVRGFARPTRRRNTIEFVPA